MVSSATEQDHPMFSLTCCLLYFSLFEKHLESQHTIYCLILTYNRNAVQRNKINFHPSWKVLSLNYFVRKASRGRSPSAVSITSTWDLSINVPKLTAPQVSQMTMGNDDRFPSSASCARLSPSYHKKRSTYHYGYHTVPYLARKRFRAIFSNQTHITSATVCTRTELKPTNQVLAVWVCLGHS